MKNTTKTEILVSNTSQGIELSAIVGDYLEHRQYIGYTLKEAKACFIEEFNL